MVDRLLAMIAHALFGIPRQPGEWQPGEREARAFYQQPETVMRHGRPHDRRHAEDHA